MRKLLSFASALIGLQTMLPCTAVLLTVAVLSADEKEKPKPADPKDKKALAEQKQALQKYLTEKSGRVAAGTAVPQGEPWVWCFDTYKNVPKQDPKVLGGWVAEHLLIADKRYLGSKQAAERRKGLGIAYEACQCAIVRLKDGKLAAMIADAYLLPNLDAADDRSWKYLGKQNVLEVVADAYAEAQDAPKFIKALEMLIDNAPNRNTEDAARFRLAQFLDRQGEPAKALKLLRQISEDAGVGGARNMIPGLEKKVKAREEKK